MKLVVRYIHIMLSSIYKRFFLATILWVVFWPVLWFIKIGDITGPKAWFWIVGELNYPVVAVAYLLLDSLLTSTGRTPKTVFFVSLAIIAIAMPFYYQRFGFALGVTIEARYL